jgi:polyisoprenoid-binding protein YceI
MVQLMTSSRIYEIDPSHTTWELHVDNTEIPNVGAELREVNGSLVFNSEDVNACRIYLWTATTAIGLENKHVENVDYSHATSPWGIRFVSWRFREVGEREYWVPGALIIGGLTSVASLNVGS